MRMEVNVVAEKRSGKTQARTRGGAVTFRFMDADGEIHERSVWGLGQRERDRLAREWGEQNSMTLLEGRRSTT